VRPGTVLERCCNIWAVTQIAPARWRCEGLGDGDGLGDFDGLGEMDLDGLGLLLGEGVGLWVWLGLGLRDGLGVRLAVPEVLALIDGLALDDVPALVVCAAASSLADTTAVELRPQGELIGRADAARAGAITKPDTRNEPAVRPTAIRPARRIPTDTAALRSSGRPEPVLPSDVRCYPRT
jgi:hypothetical protein